MHTLLSLVQKVTRKILHASSQHKENGQKMQDIKLTEEYARRETAEQEKYDIKIHYCIQRSVHFYKNVRTQLFRSSERQIKLYVITE